jgi:hypothetical protein
MTQRTRTARNWSALFASATRIVDIEIGYEMRGWRRDRLEMNVDLAVTFLRAITSTLNGAMTHSNITIFCYFFDPLHDLVRDVPIRFDKLLCCFNIYEETDNDAIQKTHLSV